MGVGVEPVLLYVSVEFEVIGQVQGGSDTVVEQIKGLFIENSFLLQDVASQSTVGTTAWRRASRDG